MIRTIIIEDERIIADELCNMLYSCSSDIRIETVITSIKDALDYFAFNRKPDLVFSDVQLADGQAFEIFKRINLGCPLVFITAYDKYIVNALEHNSIDYLLKPVEMSDLQKVLQKYNTLSDHFTDPGKFIQTVFPKKKSLLIVKKGLEHIALRLDDTVLMYTENKVVYVIDKLGRKFICEKNLAELEEELDQSSFFRANRQYIVNAGYIKGYKSYDKVKLQVDLIIPDIRHHIVVSQEMAVQFRRWINQI